MTDSQFVPKTFPIRCADIDFDEPKAKIIGNINTFAVWIVYES
jgi:hypothetical protein